jgi:hypothetical protein
MLALLGIVDRSGCASNWRVAGKAKVVANAEMRKVRREIGMVPNPLDRVKDYKTISHNCW